ncbi:MAG: hypothetical protein R3C68_07880 [Myxococcota bacterium]
MSDSSDVEGQPTEMVDDAELIDAETEIEVAQGKSSPPSTMRLAVAVPDFEDITAQDQAFIAHVFDTVKDVDFRAPPPAPTRGLTGLDKKINDLRESVRRIERELARVGSIWRIKQRRIEQVEGIISAETARREQSDQRYEQMRDQASRSAESHRQETERLNEQIDTLQECKSGLEADISRLMGEHTAHVADLQAQIAALETAKEAMHQDFCQKIDQAERAFNQLREQSSQGFELRNKNIADLNEQLGAAKTTISNRDEAIEAMQAKHAEVLADLKAQLQANQAALQGTEDELESLKEAHRVLQNRLETQQRDAEQKLHERDESILAKEDEKAELTSELETLREEYANHVKRLEADSDALRTEHAGHCSRLENELNSAKQANERVAGRLADREETIKVLTSELKEVRSEFSGREKDLRSDLEAAQSDLSKTSGQLEELKAELEAKTRDVEHLSKRISDLESGGGANEESPAV